MTTRELIDLLRGLDPTGAALVLLDAPDGELFELTDDDVSIGRFALRQDDPFGEFFTACDDDDPNAVEAVTL